MQSACETKMADPFELAEMHQRLNLPQDWLIALDKLQGIEQVALGWRYTGEHDVKPLATMLASGEPVPPFVAKTLAVHLDPPKSRWTGHLKYSPPPTRAVTFWKRRRKMEDIQAFYNQEMKQIGSASAIKEAAQKFGVSEGTVHSLIGKNLESEAFNEAAQRLDPSTLKP